MGPKKVLLLKTGSMTGSGLPRTSSRVESIFLRSDNCFLFPSLRFTPPNAPLSPVGDNPVFPRRAQLTVSLVSLCTELGHPTPPHPEEQQYEAILRGARHLPQRICDDLDLSPDHTVRVQENMAGERQLQHGLREQRF